LRSGLKQFYILLGLTKLFRGAIYCIGLPKYYFARNHKILVRIILGREGGKGLIKMSHPWLAAWRLYI
jgi:hypothetical protein